MAYNNTNVTSQFNMSVATLQRIDQLLQNLHQYNTIGNPSFIQRTIYCFYKELYPFLNDPDREVARNIWDSIIKSGNNPNMLLKEMHTFEFWLRDQLFKKKLLMSLGDDPTEAILDT